MKILKEVQKDRNWVSPVKRRYLGKIHYGSPIFNPWNFCGSILKIRKNPMKYGRLSYFKLFGLYIYYGWPIYRVKIDLGWKDKYDSPRHEWNPSYQIWFFKWQYIVFYGSPDGNDSRYWEQYLWYSKYSNKSIIEAKMSWPWVDFITKATTWCNDYRRGFYE